MGLSANLQPPIKVRRAILEEEIDDMHPSGKGLAYIFRHIGVSTSESPGFGTETMEMRGIMSL